MLRVCVCVCVEGLLKPRNIIFYEPSLFIYLSVSGLFFVWFTFSLHMQAYSDLTSSQVCFSGSHKMFFVIYEGEKHIT